MIEYGIIQVGADDLSAETTIHRESMTEAEAREWIDLWESDGGLPDVFRIVHRKIPDWTLENE